MAYNFGILIEVVKYVKVFILAEWLCFPELHLFLDQAAQMREIAFSVVQGPCCPPTVYVLQKI
jgi:hypothetical protein